MKVLLSGRVNPEYKEKLEAMAINDDRTVSYILDKILGDYFSKKNTGEVA